VGQKPPKKKPEAKTYCSSARSQTISNSSRPFFHVTVKVNTKSLQLNASPSSTIIRVESESCHISALLSLTQHTLAKPMHLISTVRGNTKIWWTRSASMGGRRSISCLTWRR
jgi:hypothetical protein